MYADTLPEHPDDLIKMGYERREEETSESGRWAEYRKRVRHSWETVAFDIVLVYHLSISDDPLATWTENCDYFFEEVRMIIWNERDESTDGSEGDQSDERTQQHFEVGMYTLFPATLAALEAFAGILGYRKAE